MRRWFFGLSVVIGLLALAACAAEEKAAPAAAPAAPAAKPAWEAEWERVLEAAKREGKVSVLGSVSAAMRQALTEPFERKYGIAVEYLGSATGVDLGPRLEAERGGGQYLWDVVIHGTSIHLAIFKPKGWLEPMEPTLILPEVKDPKSWFGGNFPWVDKDRTHATFLLGSIAAFVVNPSQADPSPFRSYKDLLDPKWKGKLLIFDPNIPGAGLAAFTHYYANKDLGPDFIRALARQEPTLTRDYGQHLEWVAQGRFPIAIGAHGAILKEMRKAGLPLRPVDPAQMREGGFIASAIGTVGLVSRAPHPNAARVYVNWLLSKEGQASASRGIAYASARTDAPTDHLEPWELPKPGFYLLDTEEARILENTRVKAFVAEAFAR